jgi:hypothetical protein
VSVNEGSIVDTGFSDEGLRLADLGSMRNVGDDDEESFPSVVDVLGFLIRLGLGVGAGTSTSIF